MSAIPRNSLETSIGAPSGGNASMLKTVAHVVAQRVSAVWKFWAYRRTMTQLVSLDDHMLKDIGITRGDLLTTASLLYSEDPGARLRLLAMERRASERAWSREIRERRKKQARRNRVAVCEPYKSTDQRDADPY